MNSIYLKSVKDTNVNNKTVFLRADLDVPVKSGEILDTTRLEAWFPTLEYLLKNKTQVFIAGHLGRPKDEDEKFSLKPVAGWIKETLEFNNELKTIDINGFKAWEITENLFLLENLRFYKEEEKNDKEFSKKLASLAEIYINDSFASSHRTHASIVGITKYLPSFAGFRLKEEIKVLSQILKNPKRPLVVIIGGAKIETKLPLIEHMYHFADYILVGGKIAENDKVLLKVAHEKITGRKSSFLVADLTEDSKDITVKSTENFLRIVENAQTVVWNGPMGVTEEEDSSEGTRNLALGILKSNAYSVVGGGDSLSCLRKQNFLSKFSFVSVGGGAMLEFLSGKKLPGLVALDNS